MSITVKAADQLFIFPPSPSPERMEWAGTPIGASNTITRTKGRTQVHDKTIDDKPGRYEELSNAAVAHLALHAKEEQVTLHDVIIHGIRVRAITNSRHLAEFWKENWYDPAEWAKVTGVNPPEQPQVLVYAFGGVEGQPEAAYYSRKHNHVIFFNTSYYGQLKSWVLGAVGRVLAEEYGIHSIHGAGVDKDGKGILYIAPTGTGKSTSSYGLMSYPKTRFHSDDWVYVRYAYTAKDGRKISPVRIEAGGRTVRGFRCYAWLEAHGKDAVAVHGLTLNHQPVIVAASDIDFTKPLEAYAYISERYFYLRCNIVESFPETILPLLNSVLENVPDVTPEFMATHAHEIEVAADAIMQSGDSALKARFEGQSRQQIETQVARLFAFDNARALLNITKVFKGNRSFTNPLEPMKLEAVMLLSRNMDDPAVLESLPIDIFMELLMIGRTPAGTREISYNAYRAVDDAAESAFVKRIEKTADDKNVPIYRKYLAEIAQAPESLFQEFELFRVMHQAANCYQMNTILQKDPAIPDRKTAVEETIKIIAFALEHPSRSYQLLIDNYRSALG